MAAKSLAVFGQEGVGEKTIIGSLIFKIITFSAQRAVCESHNVPSVASTCDSLNSWRVGRIENLLASYLSSKRTVSLKPSTRHRVRSSLRVRALGRATAC